MFQTLCSAYHGYIIDYRVNGSLVEWRARSGDSLISGTDPADRWIAVAHKRIRALVDYQPQFLAFS